MRLLLKHCDILATENGGFRWIKDGYLGVDGSVIDYIGAQMPAAAYDAEKDMTGRLLTPGFINCHTHAAMTLLRGVGSDLPLQEWLFDHMFPVEARMTAKDIRAGTALALLEMISTGTTSFSDMYMEPETAVELAGESGIKVNLCRPTQCFDPKETYAESFRCRESLALFRQYHGAQEGRVRVDFSIHAEYTNQPHIVQAYSEDCRALGGRMHLHLSETKKEHDECVAKYGKTPTRWFYDLGTLDSPTAAAHCVWVTEEDMALLREKGVGVVHNPTSNMKLGSGFAPIPRMLELGINVTLGTDGAASNNNLNLMEELHLASILHNGHTQNPILLPPPQMLAMATCNGAKLQGRDDTGALEVGKRADIVAFDTTKPHWYPNLEPMAMLTYSAQGSDVAMTMVDGRILYENGSFLTLDADRIFHEARAAMARLYPQG